jgi:tetratricopeptide (TPR) repeat protein
MGRYQEATVLFEDIIRRGKSTHKFEHPDTLSSQHNLAIIYGKMRRFHEAIELLEDTIKRRRSKLGSDHPDTLSSQQDLAIIYGNLGRHQEAAELLENTLELMRKEPGSRRAEMKTRVRVYTPSQESQSRMDKSSTSPSI